MLISLILMPFWSFLSFLLGLLPDISYGLPNWFSSFASLMKIGLSVFPIDVWVVVTANLMFWTGIHLAWSVIEWLYKKVPGIS